MQDVSKARDLFCSVEGCVKGPMKWKGYLNSRPGDLRRHFEIMHEHLIISSYLVRKGDEFIISLFSTLPPSKINATKKPRPLSAFASSGSSESNDQGAIVHDQAIEEVFAEVDFDLDPSEMEEEGVDLDLIMEERQRQIIDEVDETDEIEEPEVDETKATQ